MDKTLTYPISEIFYSIQGEGFSRGEPALFVRFAGCNIVCGGKNSCLVKEGKASWHCDTENQWRKRKDYNFNEFLSLFDPYLLDILLGRIIVIFTGGEPCLYAKQINQFLDYIEKEYDNNSLHIEIETNGTLYNEDIHNLLYRCTIINCSLKLSNSGIPKEKRINVDFMTNFLSTSSFKFVVTKEEDWKEIEKDFLYDLNIPKNSIILMPGVERAKDCMSTGRIVWEMAMKHKVSMCLRDHIIVFDKTVGV